MAIRKPVQKKVSGIFTRFRRDLRQKFAHSPAKKKEYNRRLKVVKENVRIAKAKKEAA